MSFIKDALKKQKEQYSDGVFGAILGIRGAGKTSSIGTLKGKTLMFKAAQESGCKSAQKLNPDMDVLTFNTPEELDKYIDELLSMDKIEYDNIAVDSLSRLNNMIFFDKKIQAVKRVDGFKAYDMLGKALNDRLEKLKELSYKVNVWFTLAINTKRNAEGEVVDLKACLKGNVTLESFLERANVVVTIIETLDEGDEEEGKSDAVSHRWLLTKSYGGYKYNRVDGLLDADGSLFLEADLSKLVDLINN